eukprot:TRINITY_DN5187_c0_g2_i2.p1 TRINITY_DN5187_c0_g2~~TRINITY_DN5187_c0_g2_i2.p1  ORF type:complete len:730 (+),score=153.96 TRINITY_DN5187_c0_g2_i2:63-2252(+)
MPLVVHSAQGASNRAAAAATSPRSNPEAGPPPTTATRLSFHDGSPKPNKWDKQDKAEAPRWMQIGVNCCIVFNALQLGVSAEYPEADLLWGFLEIVLTFVWAFEAGYKINLLGWRYFYSGWNRLDFVLAFCSMLDAWIMPVYAELAQNDNSGNGLGNMQAMRLLRLLRVLRMARLIETRKELLVLVEGLFGAVRAMVWIGLFLIIIIYAGAVFCNTVIQPGDISHETYGDGDFYFDGLGASMLTLFNMCILDEWGVVLRPLQKTTPLLMLFFIGFILVTTFGVLNLIIGVIADRTMEASLQVKDMEAEKRKQEKVVKLNEMAEMIFAEDDALSLDEMEEIVQNGKVPSLLETIMEVGLPRGISVPELHLMFDMEYEGTLSKEEFSDGVYGMIFNDEFQRDCMSQLASGQLKKLVSESTAELMAEVRKLRSEVNELLTPLTASSLAAKSLVTPPPGPSVSVIRTVSPVPSAYSDTESMPDFGTSETSKSPRKRSKRKSRQSDAASVPEAAEVKDLKNYLPPVRPAYNMLPPIQWAMLDKVQAMMIQLRADLHLHTSLFSDTADRKAWTRENSGLCNAADSFQRETTPATPRENVFARACSEQGRHDLSAPVKVHGTEYNGADPFQIVIDVPSPPRHPADLPADHAADISFDGTGGVSMLVESRGTPSMSDDAFRSLQVALERSPSGNTLSREIPEVPQSASGNYITRSLGYSPTSGKRPVHELGQKRFFT